MLGVSVALLLFVSVRSSRELLTFTQWTVHNAPYPLPHCRRFIIVKRLIVRFSICLGWSIWQLINQQLISYRSLTSVAGADIAAAAGGAAGDDDDDDNDIADASVTDVFVPVFAGGSPLI